MGTPAIASRAEGPREILDHGKTGVLVETGNVPAYAAAMRRLMSNSTFADSLSHNGRSLVEQRFSAEAI